MNIDTLEPIGIFEESTEDMGLMFKSYEPVLGITSTFLNTIEECIYGVNNGPTSVNIDLTKEINDYKKAVDIKPTPDKIDIRKIGFTIKKVKQYKSSLDKMLNKFASLKDKIAFGGNYGRAIINRPKVYLKDIDERKYGILNKNIRHVNRAMDWVEKIIIDLNNLVDQDLNILTIVNRVYAKRHIYEDALDLPNGVYDSLEYFDEEYYDDEYDEGFRDVMRNVANKAKNVATKISRSVKSLFSADKHFNSICARVIGNISGRGKLVDDSDVNSILAKFGKKHNIVVINTSNPIFQKNTSPQIHQLIQVNGGGACAVLVKKDELEKTLQTGNISIADASATDASQNAAYTGAILVHPAALQNIIGRQLNVREFEVMLEHEYGHIMTFNKVTADMMIIHQNLVQNLAALLSNTTYYNKELDKVQMAAEFQYIYNSRIPLEKMANDAAKVDYAYFTEALIGRKPTGKLPKEVQAAVEDIFRKYGGGKVATESYDIEEAYLNTSNKKTGKIPGWITNHHTIANYGEDEPDEGEKEKKSRDIITDDEDDDSLSDIETYRRPSSLASLDDDDAPVKRSEPVEDDDDDEEYVGKKSKGGNVYTYNYTYNYRNSHNRHTNSFNKSADSHDDFSTTVNDDNSTDKRVHSNDNNSHNKRNHRNVNNDSNNRYHINDDTDPTVDEMFALDPLGFGKLYTEADEQEQLPPKKKRPQPPPEDEYETDEDETDDEEDDNLPPEEEPPKPKKKKRRPPVEDDPDENKPESDHPIRDAAMDIDRELTKAHQTVKSHVQDVDALGRAVTKPVRRAAGWIGDMINKWKDADENKIKEQMADPRGRKNLFNAIGTAIKYGSLAKAGILLNPVFLALSIYKKLNKNANATRLRNEMIGELKAEIDIINKKIEDINYSGDKSERAAKYKLIRFKNELEKKLLRVTDYKGQLGYRKSI